MPLIRYFTVMVSCLVILSLYHCNAEASEIDRKYCWSINGGYKDKVRGFIIPCLTEHFALFETKEQAEFYDKNIKRYVGQPSAWLKNKEML